MSPSTDEDRTVRPTRTVSAWRRGARATLVAFVLGMIGTMIAFFATIMRHPSDRVSSTVVTEIGPVTFFESVRSVGAAGTEASLTPGLGVLLLLVVIPVLSGVLEFVRERRTQHAD